MDELNYRRILGCQKRRCEACGATAYVDPAGVYRCVVCDHERFDTCLDCGHLRGWCECPPPEPIVPTRPRKREKKARAGVAKTKN